MMEAAFHAYSVLCLILGVVCLFGVTLWALGHAFVGLLQMLKVWHVLTLCVGVLRHGSDYRERLFWQAIQERASRSKFEANAISNHAMKAAPEDGGDEL